jgi:hypothetical protein
VKRLWRWLRQQDRVEQLDAERTALAEKLQDVEGERDGFEIDNRSLASLNHCMRTAMRALRDVNAELDQRCIDLEKVR